MKTITLPWSKSITNRNLILASLANWKSVLKSILISDDTKYMIEALKNIWIKIKQEKDTIIIDWWINKINWKDKKIYVWQSWTCIRFLTALFILNKNWEISISWEKRLNQRPIWDLLDWMKQMWVNFTSNWNFPPITITLSRITNNKIKMNWNSSSQFFTALLQIAPLLKNWLEIEVIGDLVSKPYIDITINEIHKFWVEIKNINYKKFIVETNNYKNVNLVIEWDASALSYIANYIVLHGSTIKIDNIWKNTKQWDYKYLEKLKIFWLKYSSQENNTILEAKWIKNKKIEQLSEINFENMPDVSMSYMILALFQKWNTKISWLQTLNLKECKRIDAMKNELKKLWIKIESDEKSITIWELDTFPKTQIDIETYDDHRIAMVFGVLNSFIWNLNILNPDCVNKTYPNFWKDLEKLKK